MKKKIETLSEAQKGKFPKYIKQWTDIGLNTNPADRPRAEKAIKAMYKIAGLKAPKKIVWCGSPLSQGITRKIVSEMGSKLSGASVRDSVWDSVGDSVWASVRDSVWASVRDSVGASVRDSVWDSVGDSVYGQHDANWLAFYKFFQEECGLDKETEKLKGLWELSKSAGWALPHENICWVSERHSLVMRDDRGRLHNPNGPALSYPDGFSIYAIHGVRIPFDIIEKPETLTIDRIETEKNAEVRRVMIERHGLSRYLVGSGAKKIHQDDYGILYRKEIPGDEPLVMVKVVNSTAEPDGSFKDYFLRCPPTITTARGAVAWSFGKEEKDYEPALET